MEKLAGLRKKLKEERLDAVLISSPHNILYLTTFANFSLLEREAYLLITKEEQFILTDSRYSEAVKDLGYELVERSVNLSHKQVIEKLSRKLNIKVLAVEENNLTATEYKNLLKITNLKNFVLDRSIKNPAEIRAIEKACKLGDQTFEYILKKMSKLFSSKIKPGVSELQLAFEIEFFIKKRGAQISFPTIVAFGAHSAIPHHQTSNQKLTDSNIVLLDFGVKIDDFCSDMTRTIFFGNVTQKQKRIYKVVLKAQQETADFISKSKRPVKAALVDKVARSYVVKKGFPSIPHSLGHGVGHEIHEPPHLSAKSKEILKPGMVFTIEPGIYLPGFGGVRIEDTYLLEKDGLIQLTQASKNLIVLK